MTLLHEEKGSWKFLKIKLNVAFGIHAEKSILSIWFGRTDLNINFWLKLSYEDIYILYEMIFFV